MSGVRKPDAISAGGNDRQAKWDERKSGRFRRGSRRPKYKSEEKGREEKWTIYRFMWQIPGDMTEEWNITAADQAA
jgi:hypothetical protein